MNTDKLALQCMEMPDHKEMILNGLTDDERQKVDEVIKEESELTYDDFLELSRLAYENEVKASRVAERKEFNKYETVIAVWLEPKKLHTHLIGLDAEQVIEVLEVVEKMGNNLIDTATNDKQYEAFFESMHDQFGLGGSQFLHQACGLLSYVRDGGLEYGVEYKTTQYYINNLPESPIPHGDDFGDGGYLGNGK